MLEFIEKVESEASVGDTLTLPYDLRQKSRQRVSLDGGAKAALILAGGTVLSDGDCLRAEDGSLVRVIAATESVTTAYTDDLLCLARACYHLGNRHVSLEIGSGWLRYQPDHVLDELVDSLGLLIVRELAKFDPERGAYHGHTHRQDAAGASPATKQDVLPKL